MGVHRVLAARGGRNLRSDDPRQGNDAVQLSAPMCLFSLIGSPKADCDLSLSERKCLQRRHLQAFSLNQNLATKGLKALVWRSGTLAIGKQGTCRTAERAKRGQIVDKACHPRAQHMLRGTDR